MNIVNSKPLNILIPLSLIAVLGIMTGYFISLDNYLLMAAIPVLLLFGSFVYNQPKVLFLVFILLYGLDFSLLFINTSITGNEAGGRILLPDLFVIVFYFYFFMSIFLGKRRLNFDLPGKRYFIIFSIIWIVCFLSGLPISEGLAIGEARWYIASVFMFAIPLMLNDEKDLKLIVNVFLMIAFVGALLTWLNVIGGGILFNQQASDNLTRLGLGGKTTQWIVNGILILFINFRYNCIPKLNNLIGYALILFFMSAIILSGIRTAYLSICLLLLFYFLFIIKLKMRYVILLSLGFVALYFVVQYSPFQKVLKYQQDYFANIQTSSTFLWRMEIWKTVLSNSVESWTRILFGRPMGLAMFYIPQFKISLDYSNTHNDFLAIIGTIGWVGGIAFIIFLIANMKEIFRLSKSEDPKAAFYLEIVFFLMFSQILQSMANAEIRHYGLSILIWVHLGIFYAIKKNFLRNQRTNTALKHE